MPLTVTSLKSFVKANKSLVEDLIKAREEAPKVRAAVDAVVNPLFAKFEFWTPERERVRDGKVIRERTRITDPDKLYMAEEMDTPAMLAWDKARNEAILANFPGTPDEFCPALMAESKITELENKLLKSAGEALDPSLGNIWNMDSRAKAIKLFISAVRDLGAK